MMRTQIQLEDDQAAALKRLAADRGVSISSLIREAVDRLLRGTDGEERVARAFALGGKFSSGCPDVGTEHDRYLAEDLSD